MKYTALISVHQLEQNIDNGQALLIFDCSHDLKAPEAGREKWKKERITNAGYLHLDEDLSGPIVPSKTARHPLPSKADFIEKLKAKGYEGQHQQIVLYDQKGGGIAARAWWMFKWIGHEAVAVLNGGYLAWKKKDILATTYHENSTPSMVCSTEQPIVQYYDLPAIRKMQEEDVFLLIDSRTSERYRGEYEPIDSVAGHIEGAINLPWVENLDENQCFKKKAILENRFALLKDKAATNVFYCGSGVTACHNILAYYHVFGKMPSLYPGSWSEWIIYQ